jgi:hypothetical protein
MKILFSLFLIVVSLISVAQTEKDKVKFTLKTSDRTLLKSDTLRSNENIRIEVISKSGVKYFEGDWKISLGRRGTIISSRSGSGAFYIGEMLVQGKPGDRLSVELKNVVNEKGEYADVIIAGPKVYSLLLK